MVDACAMSMRLLAESGLTQSQKKTAARKPPLLQK
jgi:hypothetical protein